MIFANAYPSQDPSLATASKSNSAESGMKFMGITVFLDSIQARPAPFFIYSPPAIPFLFSCSQRLSGRKDGCCEEPSQKRYRPHTQPQCSRLMKNISQNANKTLLKCYTLREPWKLHKKASLRRPMILQLEVLT